MCVALSLKLRELGLNSFHLLIYLHFTPAGPNPVPFLLDCKFLPSLKFCVQESYQSTDVVRIMKILDNFLRINTLPLRKLRSNLAVHYSADMILEFLGVHSLDIKRGGLGLV